VNRFTALLFDLDGTLLDSSLAICEAASSALRDLGVGVRPDEIEPHLGAPLQELYELFVGDGNDERVQRFVLRYIHHHDAHPERHPPPLPGVVAALDGLRARYDAPLAVATTKPSDRAYQQLEAIGMHTHFAHVQGTDPGMQPKPAPDVIVRACERLRVKPSEVLMVGDTARDVNAALEAGATPVVVAYTDEHATRAATLGAERVVRSLEELVGAQLG
jgi:HAD superfamily hydrolase (TIGR01509 family)